MTNTISGLREIFTWARCRESARSNKKGGASPCPPMRALNSRGAAAITGQRGLSSRFPGPSSASACCAATLDGGCEYMHEERLRTVSLAWGPIAMAQSHASIWSVSENFPSILPVPHARLRFTAALVSGFFHNRYPIGPSRCLQSV